MKYWIFPCDIKQYDIEEAFHKFDKVQWQQNMSKIQIGDYVLIYITSPEKKVKLVCEVIDTNMKLNERKYLDADYITDNSNEQKLSKKHFVMLKKKEEINISLEELKANGLTGGMQFQRECNTQVVSYILSRI